MMMKRISVLIFHFCLSFYLYGQEITSIEKYDWNKLQSSGFFSIIGKYGSNSPEVNGRWWWGVNTSYVHNGVQYYNGQIAFSYNDSPVKMFVRVTDKDGNGQWAKVLHSKGNHAIDGKLIVKELEVKINTGADFVFDSNYNLQPLSVVEQFVKENKHLPDIPSEKEMVEKGVSVNEMQMKLLQKIEELTLYVIDLKKENLIIKGELQTLKNKH